jgi:plasmid stabilization system protein ParE
VKIVLLEEAQQRFESEDTWWRANRDAQELFVEEFSAVLGQISSMPEVGQRYRRTRGKLVQRVLMPKTRCHVYYFHDQEQSVIEVHSVWGARRERGPTL